MGPPENLILFDTSEVLRAGSRNLHCAWMEVHNRRVAVTGTVATELAPTAMPPDAIEGRSLAEYMLDDKAKPLTQKRRLQVRRQAWWANVWRDANAPYDLRQLSDDETRLSEELARQIPATCFTGAKPAYVPDHRDTKIVCEALATGATLLLTSNMRSIDQFRLNSWCEKHGARLGFEPRPVVYHADETLAGWVENDAEMERGLHAALLSCWPSRNDAPRGEVFRKTLTDLRRITGWPGAPLHAFGTLLEKGLTSHPDPLTLVGETRQHLPSPTIDTDRQHPSYPQRRGPDERYEPVVPAKKWEPTR